MSGTEDCFPSRQECTRYLFQQYRSNPQIGMLFTHLLVQDSTAYLDYSKAKKLSDLHKLLYDLEENPFKSAFFIEVTALPHPLPATLGVCVYCERLSNSGYVYVITLIDENTFPNFCAGRIEVRANQAQPEPMFSVLGEQGFENFHLHDYQNSLLIVIALNALHIFSETGNKSRTALDKINNLKVNPALIPPKDSQLLALLVSAMNGRLKCVQTKIPVSMIQPYSLDFCFSYPIEEVKWAAKEIQRGSEVPIIVYWNGTCFITSDDYSHYLGFRSLNYKEVPVVIIGKFPKEIVGEFMIGGPELIPPPLVRTRKNYEPLPIEVKNWILDKRLQEKESSEITSRLYGFFIWLAMLLGNPSTKEQQLHEFLRTHPVALDPHGSCVMSEVKLGYDYRIDLIIQYKLEDKRLLLVELEKATLPIFTKSGRLRSHVTHAIQQVEDWLQWWHEHPNDIPKTLDGSIPPQGLVVIGRSEQLDDRAKRRLLHLNHNRFVKVITYDDLLDRIESLVESLQSLES
jgi:hypothetical protein